MTWLRLQRNPRLLHPLGCREQMVLFFRLASTKTPAFCCQHTPKGEIF